MVNVEITESLQDSVAGASPAISTRVCSRCKKNFLPSSRHKCCPKCRGATGRRIPCSICEVNLTQYDRCRACANKSRIGAGSYRYISKQSGYITLRIDGTYVQEHRYVMSESIGRDLLPGENVHHKNGDRADNRLENLELWSTYQPTGQRVEDKVNWAEELLRLYAPEKLK